jgi:hypothetical protein
MQMIKWAQSTEVIANWRQLPTFKATAFYLRVRTTVGVAHILCQWSGTRPRPRSTKTLQASSTKKAPHETGNFCYGTVWLACGPCSLQVPVFVAFPSDPNSQL